MLIPGSVDLTNNRSEISRSINSLRRFHQFIERCIIRGFDWSTKQDFLSMLLRSSSNEVDNILLLAIFDESGLKDIQLFSNFASFTLWNVERQARNLCVEDLHSLLVRGYLD